jgi:energy-coupling factor transporter ATP-binding protein EcfA2
MGNDKAKIKELTSDERKKLIETLYILFPRLARIKEKIKYCHLHSKNAAEPECMLITGKQGSGKTTLCKDYARAFPRIITKEKVIIPVLTASTPAPATLKSLPTRLLTALGDPFAERGTTVGLTLRIIKFFNKCGVELVILDEFQHFIDTDSNVILLGISNWLKDLINETRRPVIVVGMPHSEKILQANPQLERRFAMRESLDPFGWGIATQQQEFKTFLRVLDERLPFPKRANLTDHETAFRIYCATSGVIGYIMKLVRRAAIMAIDRRADCLDLELLAEAYDERLAAGTPTRVNPFLVEPQQLFPAPLEQPVQETESKRAKKYKPRGNKLNQ